MTAPKKPTDWKQRIVSSAEIDPRSLVPNPRNWRTHPLRQKRGLKAVLEKVGWVQRVIVNRTTGRMVDGHLRVALALEHKAAKVPVDYIEVSEEEEALILATLDPLSALAEGKPDVLGDLMKSIQREKGSDIDSILATIGARHGPPAEVAAERAPKAPGRSAAPARMTTEPGDLIILGRHRLLCGDATKPEDVDRLMDGLQADVVVVDPPYAVYGSATGIAADITDDKMVRPFFREIVRAIAGNLKTFGHFYICCDWRSWASWWEVAKGTGLAPKNMIVWDKLGAGLGSNYANTHELLFFGSRVPTRELMTEKLAGIKSVNGSNIWRIPRVKAAGRTGGREHNAQKPLKLVSDAIENSTDPGQLVLDLCGGAGTTMIAADKIDRRCFMMEIDPRYCDTIIRRWEETTNLKAERPKRPEPPKRSGRGRAKA